MATKAELKKIAVKLIKDDSFRATFEANPKKAASSLGITLTEEQIASIKKGTAEAATGRDSKSLAVQVW